MNGDARLVIFACSIAGAATPSRPLSAQRASAEPPALAFEGVTVIDVTDGRLLSGHTVVVAGNRIQAVGPAGIVRPPQGAQIVDARGKYMVPGFWDMHIHLGGGARALYPNVLAHGVTGIRDIGVGSFFRNGADSFRVWQRDITAGTVAGPRMVGPSSYITARTPEAAARIVDSLKTAGDAFIKHHNDPNVREAYFTVLREGRRLGIPIIGHVPRSVTTIEAADSGVYSIEHLHAHYWGCFRSSGLHGGVAPIDTAGPATLEQCAQIARALIRNGTWLVPTLAIYQYYERNAMAAQQFTRLLRRLGVKNFLTGTDFAPQHAYAVPHLRGRIPKARGGMEVLDEIMLLAGGGLTPLEALQAATLNPAKYLKGTDSLGTVAAGKLADVVLLDGNPLADIRNIKKIRAVVANGRYFDRAALDALDPDGVRVQQAEWYFEGQLGLPRRPAPAASDFAFRGVTVVDVTDGRRIPDQTVVVVGNRIQAVGPAASVRVPAGAQVIEARGKFLIPGLWDMHVEIGDPHFYRYVSRQDSIYHGLYPRFLAHGVTGIREMGQHFQNGADSLRAWQRAIVGGTRIGPRAIGPSVDLNYGGERSDRQYGIQIKQADAAGAVLDSLKRAADPFVTFSTDRTERSIYFAMARGARRVGLPLAGDVPSGVSVVEAADSGQRSVEYVKGYRQCWPTWPATFDSAAAEVQCGSAAQAYARHGTWMVPALARANYIDGNVREAQRFVGAMRRLGVKTVLAGSGISQQFMEDTVAFRPGRSAAEEVVFLAGAGLTPLEALQAATLNPAKFLAATDSLGTVAPGKLADLVLLDGDPLADLRNVTRVRSVVANGRYFDRALLDTLDPEGMVEPQAPGVPETRRGGGPAVKSPGRAGPTPNSR